MRSLLSIALLVGGLFAMFSVDLGGLTFAEHMDTISETPEAQQLVEGTRSRLNPALQELRDRVLGEYVEAPTWIADEQDPGTESFELSSSVPAEEELVPASGIEPALPGQRRTAIGVEPQLEEEQGAPASLEPPLPGHRPPTTLELDPVWEPPLPGRG